MIIKKSNAGFFYLESNTSRFVLHDPSGQLSIGSQLDCDPAGKVVTDYMDMGIVITRLKEMGEKAEKFEMLINLLKNSF